MPDGLYERDILACSEQQADLIRRLGKGERVNDVDWANLAEEVEGVGRTELHAVESFLDLILVHLLRLLCLPEDQAAAHWTAEVMAFQRNARRSYTPSMRQRIDLAELYAGARAQVRPLVPQGRLDAVPMLSPFTLEQLFNDEVESLLGVLTHTELLTDR